MTLFSTFTESISIIGSLYTDKLQFQSNTDELDV